MPLCAEQHTCEALTLSEDECARLAQALLQSLEPAEKKGVEQVWAVEVARRLERVREGTARGRPADEVFSDIRARHQR